MAPRLTRGAVESLEESQTSNASVAANVVKHTPHGVLIQCARRTEAFARHYHDGYTIGVVLDGYEAIETRGQRHPLTAGSVYLSNPAEIHDGQPVDERGWSFLSFYFDRSALDPDQGEPIFEKFLADRDTAASIARLLPRLGSRVRLAADTAFQSLVSQAFRERRLSGGEPTKVAMVADYIESHYAEDLALAQLAALVDLHPRYLISVFKKEMGVTPHAYLIAARCNAAMRALCTGAPIARVAADCGFYDQSHLCRHLYKTFGVTPGVVSPRSLQDA